MRRTYLLLFREFKSNLILKIIYIIYVLLSAAVAIFALLEMIVEDPLGAFFGGLPLEFGLSYSYPSLVGAGLAGIGLLLCLAFMKKYKPVI